MIRAIIFDLDGVIVDSEPLWENAMRIHLLRYGIHANRDKKTERFISKYIRGRSEKEGIASLKKHFGLRGSYKKILKERLRILFQIFDRELKEIPGAISLIKKLHANGYPLILASSSPEPAIRYILLRYKLRKYFKAVISGENFKKGKPHPDIFLACAKIFKEKPSSILVIEDSISGVAAAHRAGMVCIALKQPYTPRKDLQSAYKIIGALKEITLSLIQAI